MVSQTVFAYSYQRGSNRLTKKTYSYARNGAVNYCAGGASPLKKNKTLHSFVPPNNKILLDYKNSIIYPDEAQLEAERMLDDLKRNKKNQEVKEVENILNESLSEDKKGKPKKMTLLKRAIKRSKNRLENPQTAQKRKRRSPYQEKQKREQQTPRSLPATYASDQKQTPKSLPATSSSNKPIAPKKKKLPQQQGPWQQPNKQRRVPGEDSLNPKKFIDPPGNIPSNYDGKNKSLLNRAITKSKNRLENPQPAKKRKRGCPYQDAQRQAQQQAQQQGRGCPNKQRRGQQRSSYQ